MNEIWISLFYLNIFKVIILQRKLPNASECELALEFNHLRFNRKNLVCSVNVEALIHRPLTKLRNNSLLKNNILILLRCIKQFYFGINNKVLRGIYIDIFFYCTICNIVYGSFTYFCECANLILGLEPI